MRASKGQQGPARPGEPKNRLEPWQEAHLNRLEPKKTTRLRRPPDSKKPPKDKTQRSPSQKTPKRLVSKSSSRKSPRECGAVTFMAPGSSQSLPAHRRPLAQSNSAVLWWRALPSDLRASLGSTGSELVSSLCHVRYEMIAGQKIPRDKVFTNLLVAASCKWHMCTPSLTSLSQPVLRQKSILNWVLTM